MEKSRSVLKIFNLVYLEAAPGGVLLKNVFLKFFANFSRKTPVFKSLFNKVAGPQPSGLQLY